MRTDNLRLVERERERERGGGERRRRRSWAYTVSTTFLE
jgi:hypothetical protein